jgi:guanylate kinase
MSEAATINASHRLMIQDLLARTDGGFALVVSGPSGVGKTSICEATIAACADVGPCVTTTTRPIRDGEVDGVDYHFVTEEAFASGVEEGAFLEHATVYDYHYGASIEAVEAVFKRSPILLVDVDVQGAQSWRHLLGDYSTTLFVLPPSIDELAHRLCRRQSEEAASLKLRTERAYKEMKYASTYDYVVVNHRLEDAIEQLKAVLRSEKLRSHRNAKTFRALGLPLPEPVRGE